MTDNPQNDDMLQEPSPVALEEQLAKCEASRDEYLSGWQRAKADFLNYKQSERERIQDAVRYAAEDMMRELIITLDNFDLAISALEKSGGVEKGIYMIRAQLSDTLKKQGLEPIPATLGEQFDPKTQEAVALMDSDKPGGTVLEQIECGYRFHDKIIRPSRVKIAKDTAP